MGQLVDALLEHHRYLREHDLLEAKQRERMVSEMLEIITQRVGRAVEGLIREDGPMSGLMHQLLDTREVDPHTGAALIIEKLKETNGVRSLLLNFHPDTGSEASYSAANIWQEIQK